MPTRAKIPFLGHYSALIDDKGRLSIPADFRHAMPAEDGGTIVLFPGSSSFLNAFPLDLFNTVWEQTDSSALGFATLDSLARDTALLSEAAWRQLDTQGRITVPQTLLKQASIGREVMFMGRWNHFVIWDAAAFDAYRTSQNLTPGEIWQKLAEQSRKS
jgi:MraZ protein